MKTYCLVTLALISTLIGCTQSATETPRAVSQSATGSVVSDAVIKETEQVERVVNDSTAKPQASGVAGSEFITPTPEPRVVAKPVTSTYSAAVPPVLLSDSHRQQCLVNVSNEFPGIEVNSTDGKAVRLSDEFGDKATVILLWSPDRWMSRAAIADLGHDVASQTGVRVLAVAVGDNFETEPKPAEERNGMLQLVDPKSQSLEKVGTGLLPRTYVLDAKGVIAWFDVEYSEATRRELQTTLDVLKAM